MFRRFNSSLLLPSYSQARVRSRRDAAAPRLWDGLVGLWAPGFGPTGGRLWDWSGYGGHGTLTNMEPAGDWVAGPQGWMLDCDGDNEYVNCGAGAATNLTGNFTVAAWASSNAPWNPGSGKNRPLVVRNSPYLSGYGLNVYERSVPAQVWLEGWSRATSTSLVQYHVTSLWVTGRVYHMAVTLSGSTLVLYWDGRAVASNGSALPPGSNSGPFRIAYGNHALHVPWPGRIGTVAVWNRGLAAAEIRRLYEDPGVLVRAACRRVGGRLGPPAVVLGPCAVDAGAVFVTGRQAGQVQSTGSVAAEVFTAGPRAGQTYG